ncbi:MAG: pilus assembly protein PilM [Gammaproteobacteria bacterium]
MSALVQRLSRFKPERTGKRVGPIGVHLADETLHAVQLGRSADGNLGLRSWQSSSRGSDATDFLEAPDALADLVKRTVKRGSFKGRRAAVVMPADKVQITPLTYQLSGGQTDGAVILKIMNGRLEGALEDYVIDFIPVRSSGEDRQALIASCRRDHVIAYLDILRKAGLNVESMEVGPIALRRLVVEMSKRDQAGNVLVINFGTETTYLTIISQRRLLLDQEVNFGERMLVKRIAKHLDMSPERARQLALNAGVEREIEVPAVVNAEPFDSDRLNPIVDIVKLQFTRLAEELQRTYLYTASETRGSPVDRVYFFGSIARWPGVEDLLSEMVGMPASTMPDPTVIFAPSGKTAATEGAGGPALAIATGLALMGLVDNE